MFNKSMLTLGILLFVSIFFNVSTHAEESKLSLSYLYFGSNKDYVQAVDRTNGAVQMVTPNYFDLNEDGSLKITEKFSEQFVSEMKERGVKVVPFLSNHWDRAVGEKALANREQLASEITQFVMKYNLEGVNVDLEGLHENSRNSLTDFIRILSEKMPKEKTVSIAVAANPNGLTEGWHGSYDYQKLGKYVDHMMIMTYDESWVGSFPGPVASIDFVENSIQYALDQHVSPNKILLGLPFYGRIWHFNDIYDNSRPLDERITGNGINLKRMNEIQNHFDIITHYDESKQSVKGILKIKEGGPSVKLYEWSNAPLRPGKYVIWYENERSLQKKVELVHKYGLKGIGSWSLGQEDPSIWPKLKLWLSDVEFKDVPLTYWAQEDIAVVKKNGWILGRSDMKFYPDQNLTRAEAAAILVRVLGLTQTDHSPAKFVDVEEDHWAKEAIAMVQQHKLIRGRNQTHFAPNEPVSREEMAVILSRLLGDKGIPEKEKVTFKDVNESRWSYELIKDMAEKDIFGGFNDGTFRPNDAVTRAQMAALLNRISIYIK